MDQLAEHERAVKARFRASAAYYRDIYQQDGLNPTIYRERRARALALVDQLALAQESRILEVGCGAGSTAVALAQRGFNVYAIDIVDPMVDLTRQLAGEAGVAHRVWAGLGDVHCLPFKDGRFGLVLALAVIPCLHSAAQAIKEMARVVQTGGFVVLTADNLWNLHHSLDPRCFPALRSVRCKLRDLLEAWGIRTPRRETPPLRRYSIREFDSMLLAAGLAKLTGMTLGFGPFTLFNHKLLSEMTELKVHRRLQYHADCHAPLIKSAGSDYIVLARKTGSEA